MLTSSRVSRTWTAERAGEVLNLRRGRTERSDCGPGTSADGLTVPKAPDPAPWLCV